MAYDAARSQMVLFGGENISGNVWSDTWTLQMGAVNLGTANVCPSGATTPAPCSQLATLSFQITAGTTIGSISVVTQWRPGLDFNPTPSDTSTTLCTPQTYSSTTTCTVDVTFTPTAPGQRIGAVVFKDGSGNLLSTSYVYGTGTGPQVAFLPGAESLVAWSYPTAVAVDGSGNVYVADDTYKAVHKYAPGSGGYTPLSDVATGLNYPNGVAVDGSGIVYIADAGSFAIHRYAPNGSGGYTPLSDVANGSYSPNGVAVDGSGNVYIADTNNSAIHKYAPNGSGGYTTLSDVANGLNHPYGVAVDASGMSISPITTTMTYASTRPTAAVVTASSATWAAE